MNEVITIEEIKEKFFSSLIKSIKTIKECDGSGAISIFYFMGAKITCEIELEND